MAQAIPLINNSNKRWQNSAFEERHFSGVKLSKQRDFSQLRNELQCRIVHTKVNGHTLPLQSNPGISNTQGKRKSVRYRGDSLYPNVY